MSVYTQVIEERFIKPRRAEMEISGIKREIIPGGSILLSSGDCTFLYQRPRPGVLQIMISGHDTGQFGTSTLDEILTAINRVGKLELFIDAREAFGAAVSVSDGLGARAPNVRLALDSSPGKVGHSKHICLG